MIILKEEKTMTEYKELEMEVVEFSTEDVIDDSVSQIPLDSDMAEWLP